MRSIPLPRKSTISFVALLLGGIITGMLMSVRPTVSLREISPPRNVADSLSIERINELTAQQEQLMQELTLLRAEQTQLQKDTTSNQSSLEGIRAEIDREKQTAGLIGLHGPGVIVTLNDNTGSFVPDQTTDVNRYIIHQQQLVTLVGVLWNAQAEAISINDQRITDQTSIYCVGSTILVNQKLLAPPFVVQAIGDPTALEGAVTNSPMLADMWQRQRDYGIEVTIKAKNQIEVPGYNGPFTNSHLEPTQ